VTAVADEPAKLRWFASVADLSDITTGMLTTAHNAPPPPPHRHRDTAGRRPRHRAGFTLIEAAIVAVIVGVSIVGMLQLMAAGTMANTESTELTTAIGLASNVHEMAMGVPYTSLFSTLDNKTYSPPVDAKGNTIGELPNWKQTVDVSYVDENNIRQPVPDTQTEPTARITITISHNNRLTYTTSWLVTQ
jgi:type II secretory pathway pseudopilin PulG